MLSINTQVHVHVCARVCVCFFACVFMCVCVCVFLQHFDTTHVFLEFLHLTLLPRMQCVGVAGSQEPTAVRCGGGGGGGVRYLPASSQGMPLREVNSYDYFPGHQFFMEYGLKNSIRAAIKHCSLWKLFNRKKGRKPACYDKARTLL